MIKKMLASTCIIVAAVLFFVWSGHVTSEQEVLSVKERVESSCVQCFAVEGSYPRTVEYLVDNYGLVIPGDCVVILDSFADNIPPMVKVEVR